MTTREQILAIVEQLKHDPEATDLLFSYAAALEIQHKIKAEAARSRPDCS